MRLKYYKTGLDCFTNDLKLIRCSYIYFIIYIKSYDYCCYHNDPLYFYNNVSEVKNSAIIIKKNRKMNDREFEE